MRETSPRATSAPPSGRFVRAGDAEVYLQEAGPATGSPILLIHGTGAWSELWRETMTFLAGEGYRAIAIDVPPFGYSEKLAGAGAFRRELQARRLAGVLDALDLKKATILAHSVGSRPAVELALAAPDRIRALILVDPALGFAPHRPGEPPRFQPNDPAALQRAFFAAPPLRDALLGATASNPLLTRKVFEGFVSRREAVTDERVAVLRRPLSVERTTRAYGDWLENLMTGADSSLSSDFGRFRTFAMPVLLIWGDTDSVTPLWQGEDLHALIPVDARDRPRRRTHSAPRGSGSFPAGAGTFSPESAPLNRLVAGGDVCSLDRVDRDTYPNQEVESSADAPSIAIMNSDSKMIELLASYGAVWRIPVHLAGS